jgi:hypothetical protein
MARIISVICRFTLLEMNAPGWLEFKGVGPNLYIGWYGTNIKQ